VAIHTSPGMTAEPVQIFIARDIGPADGDQRPDSDEGETESSWLPLVEALAMVRRGEISNALAVTGLLAAQTTEERRRSGLAFAHVK
jgi:8-oxo-dGDP phosphatase